MGVDLTTVPASGLFNAWPLAVQIQPIPAHDLPVSRHWNHSAERPQLQAGRVHSMIAVYHSHPYRIEWYYEG
jgi:hypothetical protein